MAFVCHKNRRITISLYYSRHICFKVLLINVCEIMKGMKKVYGSQLIVFTDFMLADPARMKQKISIKLNVMNYLTTFGDLILDQLHITLTGGLVISEFNARNLDHELYTCAAAESTILRGSDRNIVGCFYLSHLLSLTFYIVWVGLTLTNLYLHIYYDRDFVVDGQDGKDSQICR